MTLELFITRRYFKSKSKQTIIALITMLSMIGVAIGVTALIVVIGVMAGFESDLKARIMGIEPHLVIDRDNRPMKDYERVVDLARHTPNVKSAWPVVELQVMLRADSRAAGALIKGIESHAALEGLGIPALAALQSEKSETGAPPRSASAAPIVIGRDLARNLGLIKGDTLFAVSPRGTLAPVGYVPYMKRFVVADFFETGMYEYDGSLAFVNIKDAQALDRIKGSATAVEIRTRHIFQTQTVKERLLSQLHDSFRARDWIQLNKNLFSALKLEKAAMFITLTLIVLVATFSITSSLVMLVMEKTKDIAVLRALGASGRTIKRIFVLQGLLIGSLGTIAGVILGTALCYLQTTYHLIRLPGDVYYITALPVDLKFSDVALVALSALVICFLATLYPAQQAARLNPVEAIRYG